MRGEQNPFARNVATGYAVINRLALDDVPDHELFGGAMNGMVDVLRQRGDEHSLYIPEQDANEFEVEMRQQFGGIGVRIRLLGDPPRLMVVQPPDPGTPAFEANIRSGDHILEIDGQPTAALDMRELIRRMRGAVGEPISLTVLHPGEQEPVTVELVRATITIPSILGDRRTTDGSWQFMLEHDQRIAYLRIIQFGDKTVEELEQVLQQVTNQGVEGLILDLRDNAGGALDAAVAVSDMFLPSGLLIVETRGRDQRTRDRLISTSGGKYQSQPLVVLINQNSASASEIVAACWQDHQRATIVGERSFGKGTVQRVLAIGARGRSRLKLTSASYWRPSGENIHRMPGDAEDAAWGVMPNDGFHVEVSEEEYDDLQLQRSRRDMIDLGEDGANQEGDDREDTVEFVDRVLEKGIERVQQLLADDRGN